MKVRIKFTKGEEIKFIGHLDIMRLFQRAVRRAGLPIGYSKGFNPHQLMAFANPLSLGMTSLAEYGDFEFAGEVEPQEIIDKLNSVLPDGVKVLAATPLPEGTPKAMASVMAADYLAEINQAAEMELLQKGIQNFLAQKEIFVVKKTKHNLKETDIRPDIYSIENQSDAEEIKLFFRLAAGSNQNLKAELFVKTFFEFMGWVWNPYTVRYTRMELYKKEGNAYVPLDWRGSDLF